MSDPRLESLLAPLSAESPCGADPEYDPDFLALLEASMTRAEQQYGTTVIPAQEPDWLSVHQRASALVQRTRDLRAAVMFTRSAARVEGLPGAACGLQLVRGLLERFWDDVHPRLDPNDGRDPTARLNALQALSHAQAGLADLRSASLTGRRGGVTVRDLELALGRGLPLPGESLPSEDAVLAGAQAAIAARLELAEQMLEAAGAGQALVACFEQRLGAANTPDLEALCKLLAPLAVAARRAGGVPAGGDAAGGPDAAPEPAPAGALNTREDVIRSLERACEWIERNEPTNPAPLLIRRSQRLMSKSFVDIIRDLVPGGVGEIEKLAGPGGA